MKHVSISSCRPAARPAVPSSRFAITHGPSIALICIIVALVVILIVVVYQKRLNLVEKVSLLQRKPGHPAPAQQPPPAVQPPPTAAPQDGRRDQPAAAAAAAAPPPAAAAEVSTHGNAKGWSAKVGAVGGNPYEKENSEWDAPQYYTTSESSGKDDMAKQIANFRTSMLKR